ncbi:hypothetical protein CFIO01_05418 [Colletotrichum fioriniae PJ7]|uniref:Uncharacterized protein n=1 Tax=Colletotrichum fioriniae PJ7 TaxID=1445577 RepID=A0A010RR50_9PEZI|nr:hypothetical protein CFIO01_05418 [Colletotrichum fioriniae PJ7]
MSSFTHLIPAIPNTASFVTEASAAYTADLASPPSTAKERQDLLTSIQSFAPGGEREGSNDDAVQPDADPEAETDDFARQGLNVLWGMFTSTAQVFDEDDAFQDRLVGLLAWTREFDVVYRRLHGIVGSGGGGGGGGWESYGFGPSLQLAWEKLVADLPRNASAVQKIRKLAAFSAKVLAMGLWLWGGEDESGNGDEKEGEVVERGLVPAVGVWLEHASHALLSRCCSSPAAAGGLDSTAAAATNLIRPADGPPTDHTTAKIKYDDFSMSHWLRWRRRLQKLSHDADADVARLAKKGFMSMIFCGRDLGVEVEGEERFTERLQEVMYRELVRSGKGVVEGEEVEIEVNWVD